MDNSSLLGVTSRACRVGALTDGVRFKSLSVSMVSLEGLGDTDGDDDDECLSTTTVQSTASSRCSTVPQDGCLNGVVIECAS